MAEDGFVYCCIKKGMYGLKQAARLAYDDLNKHIAAFGCFPDPIATNVWSREMRKINFCLCVDDFEVQYFNQNDADHLITALQTKYDITVDTKCSDLCGLHLDWDYVNGHIDISMPDFVKKTLKKLNYTPKKKKINWLRTNGRYQLMVEIDNFLNLLIPHCC